MTDGNAVRRVDGGVLNVEWAGGITAKRSGGKVFNRDGGHRSVKRLNRTRVVHARYVAAEVAEVLTGERERWYGVEGVGQGGRAHPSQCPG